MKYYVVVNDNGTFWYKDAAMKVYHKEDGPAVEYHNGTMQWYKNGELHRENEPAVENIEGFIAWYKNGKLHREDGPAVEYRRGAKYWYLNGDNYSKKNFDEKMNPVVELTVADVEKLLGKKVKIVK